MEGFIFIVLCFMIGLIFGYPIFVICKNLNDHEDDIESLKQRIFELEDEVTDIYDEVKKLKKYN